MLPSPIGLSIAAMVLSCSIIPETFSKPFSSSDGSGSIKKSLHEYSGWGHNGLGLHTRAKRSPSPIMEMVYPYGKNSRPQVPHHQGFEQLDLVRSLQEVQDYSDSKGRIIQRGIDENYPGPSGRSRGQGKYRPFNFFNGNSLFSGITSKLPMGATSNGPLDISSVLQIANPSQITDLVESVAGGGLSTGIVPDTSALTQVAGGGLPSGIVPDTSSVSQLTSLADTSPVAELVSQLTSLVDLSQISDVAGGGLPTEIIPDTSSLTSLANPSDAIGGVSGGNLPSLDGVPNVQDLTKIPASKGLPSLPDLPIQELPNLVLNLLSKFGQGSPLHNNRYPQTKGRAGGDDHMDENQDQLTNISDPLENIILSMTSADNSQAVSPNVDALVSKPVSEVAVQTLNPTDTIETPLVNPLLSSTISDIPQAVSTVPDQSTQIIDDTPKIITNTLTSNPTQALYLGNYPTFTGYQPYNSISPYYYPQIPINWSTISQQPFRSQYPSPYYSRSYSTPGPIGYHQQNRNFQGHQPANTGRRQGLLGPLPSHGHRETRSVNYDDFYTEYPDYLDEYYYDSEDYDALSNSFPSKFDAYNLGIQAEEIRTNMFPSYNDYNYDSVGDNPSFGYQRSRKFYSTSNNINKKPSISSTTNQVRDVEDIDNCPCKNEKAGKKETGSKNPLKKLSGETISAKVPTKKATPEPKQTVKVNKSKPEDQLSDKEIEDMLKSLGLDFDNADIRFIGDGVPSRKENSRTPITTTTSRPRHRPRPLPIATTTTRRPRTQATNRSSALRPHKDTETWNNGIYGINKEESPASYVYLGSHDKIFPGLYSNEV